MTALSVNSCVSCDGLASTPTLDVSFSESGLVVTLPPDEMPPGWRKLSAEDARKNAPDVPGVLRDHAFGNRSLKAGIYVAAYGPEYPDTPAALANRVRRRIVNEQGFSVTKVIVSKDGRYADFCWYKRMGIVPMSGRFRCWQPVGVGKMVGLAGAWFHESDTSAARDFYLFSQRLVFEPVR